MQLGRARYRFRLFLFALSTLVETKCEEHDNTANSTIRLLPAPVGSLLERKLLTSISGKILGAERIKEVVRGSGQKLSEDFRNIDSRAGLNLNEGDNFVESSQRAKRQDYFLQSPDILSYKPGVAYKNKSYVPWPYAVILDDVDPGAKYYYDTERQVVVKKTRRPKKKKKKPEVTQKPQEVDEEEPDFDVGFRIMGNFATASLAPVTVKGPFVRVTNSPISHIIEHFFPPFPTNKKASFQKTQSQNEV